MDFSQHFTLSYTGEKADDHIIDFYDASQAFMGFHKSLALTTHLVLHGEVIDRVSSLKNAKIYLLPPEKGSWKITAVVVVIMSGAYALGTAPQNTPIGHLVHSAYHYILSETLGIGVDYDKTIGQLLAEREELQHLKSNVSRKNLNELGRKMCPYISEIHKPIVKTKTAIKAEIIAEGGDYSKTMGGILDTESNKYLVISRRITAGVKYGMIPKALTIEETLTQVRASVSKYDRNRYDGSMYLSKEEQEIEFELHEHCRQEDKIALILESLSASALRGDDKKPHEIFCSVRYIYIKNRQLKKVIVLDVACDEASLLPV